MSLKESHLPPLKTKVPMPGGLETNFRTKMTNRIAASHQYDHK